MPRRAGPAALLLAALLVALIARPHAARSQVQPVPPFYDPPPSVVDPQVGMLLASEPIDAPPGVRAWRIMYLSKDLESAFTAVSGLLAVPDTAAPEGGFPLVAVAHGTTGIARGCAPSIDPLRAGGNAATPAFFGVIEPYLGAGFAVVATDYEGLGAPGTPAYLVGAVVGQNVLDAARAALGFEGLDLSDEIIIWGHSEGGQSAAFAAQLWPSYAPELTVLGVVEAAPLAELSLMAGGLYGLQGPTDGTGFIMIVAGSWSKAYPDATLDSILTPEALAALGVVYDQCYEEVLPVFDTMPPSAYLKANPAQTAPWSDLLAQNTPSAETALPVLVVQGEADTLIPPVVTQIYVQRLCGAGATVDYKTYAGADHSGVLGPAAPDIITWMNGRRQAKAAPTTCTG
jgi:alpha-beta hydrolase superfamily lysophospholipase